MSDKVMVKYGDKEYSLAQIPAADNPLVKQERDRVLADFDFEDLMKGLDQCAGLINLAHNGVAGFGDLSKSMITLHDQYGKLCGKTDLELKYFADKSIEVQKTLVQAVGFIYKDKISLASKLLLGFTDVAIDLANRAEALANAFDEAGNTATNILGETTKTQALEEQKKQEILKNIDSLKAQLAESKTMVAEISKTKDRLEKLYQEAKEEAAAADSRAFGLAITSAIMGPIASGLGAFAGAYTNPVGTAVNGAAKSLAPPTPQPSDSSSSSSADSMKQKEAAEKESKEAEAVYQEKKAANDAAQKKYDAAVADQKAKEEKKAKLESDIADLQKAKDTATGKAEPTDEIDKKISTLKAELEISKGEVDTSKGITTKLQSEFVTAEEAAKKAEESRKLKAAALTAASDALSKAADNAAKMSESYMNVAVEYRKEKAKYLDMLFAKEKEEYEEKAKMSRYATEIGAQSVQKNTIAVACNSLFLAAGALKRISVIFRMASTFWRKMEAACQNLKSAQFQKSFALYSEESPEDRKELFLDDDFKNQIFQYYAGWKSIEVICTEVSKVAAGSQKKVWGDFSENLTVDAARAKAVELSKILLSDSVTQLAQSEATMNAIEAEKTALTAEINKSTEAK